MQKVLVTCKMHESFIVALHKEGFQPLIHVDIGADDLASILPELVGLVVNTHVKLPADKLRSARNLRFIARAGSGMENIDTTSAAEMGIACFNSPEGNRDAVGEHALGMLLSLLSRLSVADHEVRSGVWQREANRGIELLGKTVGIIGFGNMGSAFAEKLGGMGVGICAYDKYKSGYGSEIIKECDMEILFDSADIISFHVPLTSETKNLLCREFIEKCRKPVVIINTSRGGVVNLPALVEGLESGKIVGACLDVLQDEPLTKEMINSRFEYKYLTESPQVILTPHIAGWTKESEVRIGDILLEKIRLVMKES